MRHDWTARVLVALMVWSGTIVAAVAEQRLAKRAVNEAQYSGAALENGQPSPVVLKAQILVDRRGFSPGLIDGYWGNNTAKAITLLQEEHGLEVSGRLDATTWAVLNADAVDEVLIEYTIAAGDIAGPFLEAVPDSYREMAEVDRLAYTGPSEKLAERFHMDEELLRALNPEADFGAAGMTIVVANVLEPRAQGEVVRIYVDKTGGQLRAFDEDRGLVAAYPATVGSEETPSPSGSYLVVAVVLDPEYRYDPGVIEGDADEVLILPPGPNGPVGSIWIDLGTESYGIHGTAEPALIDKTYSHGCVRLTNWDAEELAQLVQLGITIVEFGD